MSNFNKMPPLPEGLQNFSGVQLEDLLEQQASNHKSSDAHHYGKSGKKRKKRKKKKGM